MTVQDLIREISSTEGFYNEVVITSRDHSEVYDYEVWTDNGVVYIEVEKK